MNYLEYWQLTEKPFEDVCNTRFFFESEDHREALDRLIYLVNDKAMNMGMLTGEIGCGKTITKNVLKASLSRHAFEVIDFENSNYSFNDILYAIVKQITFLDPRTMLTHEFEFPQRSDKFALMSTLKKMLEVLVYEEKRHLLVIFDEAQQMNIEVIDEIKNITNIRSESECFGTLLFLGQPELREKIKRVKQVDQRIFMRFHLNNLDAKDTVNYIRHRLIVAGGRHSGIFDDSAMLRIFHATAGVPRMINRLCKLALNYGFAQTLSELSEEHINIIIDDMHSEQ